MIGFISILAQVILLRELSVTLYGVELIYLLALGAWLLWTALGAMLGHWLGSSTCGVLSALFSGFSLLFPLDIVFIRDARQLMAGIPGAYLDFPRQMAVILISLLPISALLGLLFQRAARLFADRGRSLASAYAVESLGGALGGLISSLMLRLGMPNWALALWCSLAGLGAAFLLLKRPFPFHRIFTYSLILLLLCSALLYVPPIDWWMTSWNHAALLDSQDTPYGRITLTRSSGQVSVYENDVLWFETEGYDAEVFAQLAALQHPAPHKILILGGGLEGLVGEILKHHPLRIDYVEVNERMYQLVSRHLPPSFLVPFQSPLVRMIFEDPRQFLKSAEPYDLIMVGMGEPSSGQANRFYTRDFFEQCSRRLNPSGVLAFRLRSLENYWTPQLRLRNASICRALEEVFPHSLILPGDTNYIVASSQRLPDAPEILIDRMESRKLTPRVLTRPYIQYLYTNDRVAEIAAAIKATPAPPNLDEKPVVYQFTLLLWLSKFFPSMMHQDVSALFPVTFKPGFWSVVFLFNLVVLFFLCRFHRWTKSLLLACSAGFSGMVLETVLFLYYQVKSGILYQDMGILLTCYMLGLALGAWAMDRCANRRGPLPFNKRAFLFGVVLLLGSFSFATGAAIHAGVRASLFLTGSLQFLGATLVSALFALASFEPKNSQEQVISPLYSADIIGGAAASLLGSFWLIPILGLPWTTYAIGLLVFLLMLVA